MFYGDLTIASPTINSEKPFGRETIEHGEAIIATISLNFG